MAEFFANVDWAPLWLSLKVAAIATAFAGLVGVAIAYLLANFDFPGRELLDSLVTLPLVLPPTVLGYYLLVLLGRQSAFGGWYESWTGSPLVFTPQAAVVAAFVHAAPLLTKSARAALESVEPAYAWAARNLGASEWRVFWQVTLPLARRSILAAAALAFARALGDFGVTIMIAGNIPGRTQTVATAIYDAVEAGRGDAARALVIVVSLAAILILTIANRFGLPRALR